MEGVPENFTFFGNFCLSRRSVPVLRLAAFRAVCRPAVTWRFRLHPMIRWRTGWRKTATGFSVMVPCCFFRWRCMACFGNCVAYWNGGPNLDPNRYESSKCPWSPCPKRRPKLLSPRRRERKCRGPIPSRLSLRASRWLRRDGRKRHGPSRFPSRNAYRNRPQGLSPFLWGRPWKNHRRHRARWLRPSRPPVPARLGPRRRQAGRRETRW